MSNELQAIPQSALFCGNKLFYCTAEQGTPEWLADRLGCLSGSNIFKMMTNGKGKNAGVGKTAMGYYLELATDLFYGEAEPFEPNYAMRRGTALEPVARDEFSKKTGIAVEEIGFVKLSEDSLIGCSVDGLTDDGGIIEIKCRLRNGWTDRILNGIPKKDMQQMQWNMGVTDTDHCYYICYTDQLEENNLIVKKVERDEDMIAEMAERANDAIEQITDFYELLTERSNSFNN